MNVRRLLEDRERVRAVLLFLGLAIALYFITPDDTTNPHNGPILVANQILHGEFYLPDNRPWIESFEFNGHRYVAYPPMATFILVPYAALTGMTFGQTVANSLLIFGSAILLYAVLRRTPELSRYASLGALAWVVGTPFLYSAHYGSVWLLMHSEGAFFLLLAILLALQRRFFWAGMAFMIAGLTRFAIVCALPTFLMLALYQLPGPPRESRELARPVVYFFLGASIPAALVLFYSWSEFQNPLLNPYTAAWRQWRSKPIDGWINPFGPSHFWKNVVFYLTARPAFLPQFPYLRFDAGGQSAWLLSPFLWGVFFANLRIRLVRCLLPGALLTVFFYLLYAWQGYLQFGSRYLTDAFPLLVPMALSGFTRPRPRWLPAALVVLVGLGILFNAYGVWVISYYGY